MVKDISQRFGERRGVSPPVIAKFVVARFQRAEA
jgi:hypothetical protein